MKYFTKQAVGPRMLTVSKYLLKKRGAGAAFLDFKQLGLTADDVSKSIPGITERGRPTKHKIMGSKARGPNAIFMPEVPWAGKKVERVFKRHELVHHLMSEKNLLPKRMQETAIKLREKRWPRVITTPIGTVGLGMEEYVAYSKMMPKGTKPLPLRARLQGVIGSTKGEGKRIDELVRIRKAVKKMQPNQ